MKRSFILLLVISFLSNISIGFSQSISLVSETQISLFGNSVNTFNYVDMPSFFYSTDVQNDMVYTATKSGIVVMDISDKKSVNQKAIITNLQNQSTYNAFAIKDTIMYAASSENSIDIIDISDVTQTKVLKKVTTQRHVTNIKENGEQLILFETVSGFDYSSTIIEVLDIKDAKVPIMDQNLMFQDSYIYDVNIDESYIYVNRNVFSDYLPNICFFEIRNKSNPSEILSSWEEESGNFSRAIILGDIAYLNTGRSFFSIFDISNPSQITLIKNIELSGTYAGELIKRGNKLWLCAYSGIEELDISDPLNPISLGSTTLDGYGYRVDYDCIDDSNEIIVTYNVEGLEIVSPTSESIPKPVFLNTLASAITCTNNIAFLALGYGGVASYDISDPLHPVLLCEINTIGRSRSIGKYGDYLYVSNDWGGMEVVDASNPSQLLHKRINPGDNNYRFQSIVIDNSKAYVNTYEGNVFVLDLGDPWNPISIENIGYGDLFGRLSPQKVFVYPHVIGFGTTCYSIDESGTLITTDMSELQNPVSYTHEDITLKTLVNKNACLVDSLLFISDGDLHVFNVSNPLHPKVICSLDTEGETGVIDVNYPYIYTADVDYFKVYKYDNETSVKSNDQQIPILISQNTPNPFNPTTTISFTLPVDSNVSVDVFNVSGQKVDTLVDDYMNAGQHSVVWDASGFSNGVYFYTVRAGEYSKTIKMMLMK